MRKIELSQEEYEKVRRLGMDHYYDLAEYLKHHEKFYLFSNEQVSNTLTTDGNITQLEIWWDKFPSFYDIDLLGHLPLFRSEFLVNDASYVFIEKKFSDTKKVIRDLYVSPFFLNEVNENFKIEGVSITALDHGKLKVKKRSLYDS